MTSAVLRAVDVERKHYYRLHRSLLHSVYSNA
jgi:hypothetical protein